MSLEIAFKFIEYLNPFLKTLIDGVIIAAKLYSIIIIQKRFDEMEKWGGGGGGRTNALFNLLLI